MACLLLFDLGGGELIVILLFVLIAFGSKGIPNAARTMGRALRQLRDASAEVQREIEKGAHQVKQGFEEQRKDTKARPPGNSAPMGSVVKEKMVQPEKEGATTKEEPRTGLGDQ